MDLNKVVLAEIENTREVFTKIHNNPSLISKIVEVAEIAANAIRNGNKIMFCGNGGSAADAQHLAAEFINKLYKDRPALPAIALTTDTSILTAIGNDISMEHIFTRQIEALGQKGDVLVAISTSGASKNIVEAVGAAKKKGVVTVGFLGEDSRDVAMTVDHQINVPSNRTTKIQEAHITIGHIFCALVERRVFVEDECKQKVPEES